MLRVATLSIHYWMVAQPPALVGGSNGVRLDFWVFGSSDLGLAALVGARDPVTRLPGFPNAVGGPRPALPHGGAPAGSPGAAWWNTGRAGLARPATWKSATMLESRVSSAGRAPPLYVGAMKFYGFVADYSGSPGRPSRPRGRRCLDLVCRAAPRLIAQPEEYPEAADSRRTSHHKVGSGKKCEVGEPVDSIPQPRFRRKHR